MGIKEEYDMSPVRVWSNAFLVLLAAAPALIEVYLTHHICPHPSQPVGYTYPLLGSVCETYNHRPLLYCAVLLLANEGAYLWLLGLLHNSTWLIDIFWTLIPPLLHHLYSTHPHSLYPPLTPPLSSQPALRSYITLALVYVWAVRLTHSYLRREEWQLGAREDWRFTELRGWILPRLGGAAWAVAALFLAYVSQMPFLFAFTLPFHAVHTSTAPLSLLDALGTALSVAGLVLAERADTTLFKYRQRPAEKRAAVLEEGVWGYSRHPNYAGESAFWLGLGLLGASAAQHTTAGGAGPAWWYLAGGVCNAGLLLVVSVWVERRMVGKAERAEAYRAYQQRVSLIVPWFRKQSGSAKKKAE